MTKAELVDQVAEAIGPGVSKQDCALVVDGFLNALKRAMEDGESVELRGFGTFEVRTRSARPARNPRTGEPVHVPPRATPVFRTSRGLRERVTERARERGDLP